MSSASPVALRGPVQVPLCHFPFFLFISLPKCRKNGQILHFLRKSQGVAEMNGKNAPDRTCTIPGFPDVVDQARLTGFEVRPRVRAGAGRLAGNCCCRVE